MSVTAGAPKLAGYQRTALFVLWLVLLLVLSSWFYVSVMRPSLLGLTDLHVGADSNRYMLMGDELRQGRVEPWVALALAGFPNTLWAPVALSYVFETADTIAVLNVTLYLLSIFLLWKTFRVRLQYFLPLLFLNATTIISVLSLNKEVLDLFATATLCFAVQRRLYWLMPLTFAVAVFNRFEFAAILLLFVFLTSTLNPLRNRRVLCVVGLIALLTLAIPSIGAKAVVNLIEEQKTVSVGGAAVFLNQLQLHFLFFLAYPLKVALNLFGEVFNINKIASYDQMPGDYANTYILLLNNAANLCVCSFLLIKKRFTLSNDAVYLAVLISIVSSVSGVIQPRYFYMVYVLFCVTLSTTPEHCRLHVAKTGTAGRRGWRVRLFSPRVRLLH